MLLKTTYKDQIYEQLKIKIVDRELDPGRFYSEQFFAEMFQVSRTPVREALLQLQSEDYIEIVPNRGARVVEFTLQNFQEICQMRDAIESYCAFDLASRSHDPQVKDQLHRLQENVRRTREKCAELGEHPDIPVYVERVMNEFQEFNKLLVAHVNNGLFNAFYEKNAGRIVALDIQASQVNHQLDHAVEDHARILTAILAGDPVTAYQECHAHILDVYYAIENLEVKPEHQEK